MLNVTKIKLKVDGEIRSDYNSRAIMTQSTDSVSCNLLFWINLRLFHALSDSYSLNLCYEIVLCLVFNAKCI